MSNSLLNESKIRTTLDAEYTKFKEAVMSGKAREYYELDPIIVAVKNKSEYVNIVFQWYKDKMKSKNDKFKNIKSKDQHYVFNFLKSSTNSNGVNGYLVNYLDTNDLKNKISILLQKKFDYQKLKISIEKNQNKHIFKQYEDLVNSFI